MTWIDWVIVIALAFSMLGGLRQGFFRVAFSLAGLILGLVLAAWNYTLVAALLLPVARIEAVANAIGFLSVALLVMAISAFAGSLLSSAFHRMGLGWFDRLAGAAFGLVQGALLVMLTILVALAFFPRAHWLTEAKLPRRFFGACHMSTHIGPEELARRVRESLRRLEQESPEWLHPKTLGS